MSIAGFGKYFARLLITAGLLWWVLHEIDLDALAAKLGTISLWSLAIPVILVVLLGFIQAVRWKRILEVMGFQLEYGHLNRITMLSLFFNQTLPSTVGGDLIRVHHSQRAGIDLRVALSSVVLDRGLGLLALLLVSAFALPGLYAVSGGGPVWWSACALIGAGLLASFSLLLLRALPHPMIQWPVVREAIGLSRAIWRLVRRPEELAASLILSLVIQVGMIMSMVYLGWLLSVPVTLVEGFILYPIVLLVSMVPVSIAGWGVRESAMVVGLGLVGVPDAAALSVSLVFGAVLVLVGVVGGLIWEIEQIRIRRGD